MNRSRVLSENGTRCTEPPEDERARIAPLTFDAELRLSPASISPIEAHDMKNTSPVYIALWLLASLLLLGCGAGQSPLNLAMQVLVQSASPVFDAGKNVNLNAVVQNDFTGRGVTWSIAGVNCRGAACGSLSGTNSTSAIYVPPAAFANSFSVKITAVSIANGLITGATTLSVAQPLVITTTTLPVAQVGNAYTVALSATGGVQPYLWTVLSGSLPDGLVLNSATGVITGTPPASQIADFVVQVADFGGITATAAFSITVQNVSVSISPNATQVIEPLQTVPVTAVVQNDPANLGVRWTIAGSNCGAGNCGTLMSVTPLTVTYAAPHVMANTPVAVIATSIADPTRSATEQFIIAGPLSVATTSLLDGNVGVPYADRVFASGGIPPYFFEITAGALPPGLTIDSGSGAITSTPTLRGRYNFTVRATDAGAAFAQTATKDLSITIGDAFPLVITTPSLPDATLNAPYQLQLDATGGLKPYSWSVLATSLPGGLTMSSDGILAGTPKVVGTFPITIQVADAQSAPFIATKSFTLQVGYPHGAHDGALQGHYAFLFNGYEDGTGAVAFAGSFVSDGQGNITGGVLDSNRTSGVTLGTSFTGRYLIGVDNRGEMTTQDANGQTKKLAFSVGTADGTLAHSVRFIQFDDAAGISGTRGSGIMRLQDTAAFTQSAFSGKYVFGFAGVTPVTSGTEGPVAMAGAITADGTGVLGNGTADVNQVNSVSQSLPVSGTYTALDVTSGRASVNLQLTGGGLAALPATYILYIINTDEALILSLDLRAQKSMLSGELHKQKLNTFTTTSLGNDFVIYENGVNADVSNQPITGQTNSLVAVYSADGNGNCTLQAMDQNAGGVIQTYEQTGQGAAIGCVVQPDGRTTLGAKQTLYLYDSGTGFYIENGLAVLGHVEPQTAGPFTNASAPQTFFFGSMSPASTSSSVSVGTGSFDHQALFAPVADISTPTGLIPAAALFLPYVVDTYGRAILPDKQGGDPQGGIYVMYVLSPNRMIWFDENATNPSPSMEILEAPEVP